MTAGDGVPVSAASIAQSRRFTSVLLFHAVATVLIQSVWFAVSAMMAVLARKRFGASDWETLAITAAGPTLLVASIFWNDLLNRFPIRKYLVFHWAATMLPMLAAAAATEFWHLLLCTLVSAIGAAGWSPVSGALLKRLYEDSVRGRAFGLINMAMYLGMTVLVYIVGSALDHHENAFRFYLPAAAVAYGLGLVILCKVTQIAGADTRNSVGPAVSGTVFQRLTTPLLHMREILRGDPQFYRYEAAFMTYGVGWMICTALLPVLATDRLHMTYKQFSASTQVLYPLGMLVMLYPMGWVMDRIGPSRTSAVSFAGLMFYPLGLMLAFDLPAVGTATVLYGLAMAGVQITWMLGPVAFAPSPERVPHYVAIHATLVGIRGIVFQGLGMLLYRLTGSFTWSFLMAALAFGWAALQMWRLPIKSRRAVSAPSMPTASESIL